MTTFARSAVTVAKAEPGTFAWTGSCRCRSMKLAFATLKWKNAGRPRQSRRLFVCRVRNTGQYRVRMACFGTLHSYGSSHGPSFRSLVLGFPPLMS